MTATPERAAELIALARANLTQATADLGRHAWLTNPERTYRTCMRRRCSWGKDRLGCRHFWRDWRHRHLQLYTNACRPCRAAMARRHESTTHPTPGEEQP